MKKTIGIFLGFFILIFGLNTAMAADETLTYNFPALNMNITVPVGWITFTRDTNEEDPNLQLLGMTGDKLKNKMIQQHMYLTTLNKNLSAEIFVATVDTFASSDIYNLNSVSEDKLQKVLESYIKNYSSDKAELLESSVYRIPEVTYLFLHGRNIANDTYVMIYATIVNGQSICITLNSYSEKIPDSLEMTLKEMVNSVEFAKITEKPYSSSNSGEGIPQEICYLIGGVIVVLIYVAIKILRGKSQKKKKSSENASISRQFREMINDNNKRKDL